MKARQHPDDLRATLADAGQRRADAERARAEAMHDIASTVAAAVDAGITIVEIAQLTGLTRPTIYAMMR